MRCPHCFALSFTGSLFCGRCGRELEPEPLLDVVDAPCPRCTHRLSAPTGGAGAGGAGSFECTACGGVFVDRSALQGLLARESRPLAVDLSPSSREGTSPIATHASQPVRYLACPVCRALMNRTHFAHHSGVIVSVCKEHGTWFDAGELTSVLEFVRGA